jgi:muramoyltetrapeptide carboxypeptidase
MALNFELGGLFDQIAGLVVGGMTDMRDNPVPFGADADNILRARIGSRRLPIAFGLPAGHIADNRTLILGREVELEVSEQGGRLSYR